MTRLACLILLVLIHLPVLSAEGSYRVSQAYWIDRSGQSGLENAAAEAFTPFTGPLRLGFLKHPVWLRLEVVPRPALNALGETAETARRSAVIRVTPFPLDLIDLYWRAEGRWLGQAAGDLRPRLNRNICPDDAHCFVIEHPSSEGLTIFLKVSTRGIVFVNVETLFSDDVPKAVARRVAALSVSLVSALALLALGLAIMIFEYRSRLLLAYCGFQISILCLSVVRAGLLEDLLPGLSREALDLAAHLTYPFRVAMSLLLCWSVVAANRPTTLYHRLTLALVVASAGTALGVLFGDVSISLESAFFVFLVNAFVQCYGVFSAREISSRRRVSLFFGFMLWALLGSVGILLAYGEVGPGRLDDFPSHFGDLRLNGLPISIVFFFLILLERSAHKESRERELEGLRNEAAQAQASAAQVRDRQGFIDMLTHELQNPLSTIRFAVRSLQRAVVGHDDAGRHLHSINASVKQAVEFIEHVALMSRIETMETPGRMMTVAAGELVRDCLADCPESERFRLQADASATFLVDYQLMTVLIDNLISNALKYSPSGSLIEIVVSAHGDRTRFTITNDVSPDRLPDRSRLFERFYRHPNVLGVPGSGLGLSVAQLSAERLGATIEVQVDEAKVSFTVEAVS